MWYCIYLTAKAQQQQNLECWCVLAQNQSVNADCVGQDLVLCTPAVLAGPRPLLGL